MILRKISKIGATRCQFLRLKCTQFDFRWGSAGLRPRPRWGSLQRSPTALAVFKGLLLRGGRGNGAGEGKRRGKEMGGKGREGREGIERERRGKGGKRWEWEHAPIGIFESRRLCIWTRGIPTQSLADSDSPIGGQPSPLFPPFPFPLLPFLSLPLRLLRSRPLKYS